MKNSSNCNLIISGIGGQGINSLARVLANFFYQSGYSCQFTIHKGGAQSLGSVYAEFRISNEKQAILGPGIPEKQLDVLIALEPWEALRHIPLAHADTIVYIEQEAMPFFTERRSEPITDKELESPLAQLQRVPLSIHWQSYRNTALKNNGSIKMANYYAGLDCLNAIDQFFIHTSDNNSQSVFFDKLFFQQIKKARPVIENNHDAD